MGTSSGQTGPASGRSGRSPFRSFPPQKSASPDASSTVAATPSRSAHRSDPGPADAPAPVTPPRHDASTDGQRHQIIKQELRRRIGKVWPAGTRLPPIKRLAVELGTGQSNTHRAVQELVREGLMVSRPGLGTFVRDPEAEQDHGLQLVDWPSRVHQRSLLGKRVALMRAASEGMLDPAVDAVRRHLLELEARVVVDWYRMHDEPTLFDRLEHQDAVVLFNPAPQKPLRPRPGQALCVLSTAMDICVARPGGYDVIECDSEQGGVLVGEHFALNKVKRPCFIGMRESGANQEPRYEITSALRVRGFETGLGAPLAPQYRLFAGNYSTEHGAAMVAQVLALKPRPDAIFAASDDLAVGLVHGALAHGLTAGKDFQLAGYDGQLRARNLADGPLTTVLAPMRRMGELAALLLADRMLRPQQPTRRVVLGCSLLQGVTTRTPRETSA